LKMSLSYLGSEVAPKTIFSIKVTTTPSGILNAMSSGSLRCRHHWKVTKHDLISRNEQTKEIYSRERVRSSTRAKVMKKYSK
jgi:hypothetical protein